MKTPLTTRIASLAAALVVTFATVNALAAYALPPAADTVVASDCSCR